MKVLVAHNQYQTRGGEDQAVDNEIELLRSHGVKVIPYFKSNEAITGLADKARAALSITFNPAVFSDFKRILASEKPDVVHVHNSFPLLSPAVFSACREVGIPTVMTLHNYRLFCANALLLREGSPCDLCLSGSVLPALRYRCYRDSLIATIPVTHMISYHQKRGTWKNDVDHFFALSNFSLQQFVRAGLKPKKLSVKPNFAFDFGKFQIRNELKKQFLYVGRLSNEKGVRTLINAWKTLPYPLTIVGEGPLRESLERELPPNVSLAGKKSRAEVEQLMRNASALVLPSECFENFPLVIAEAYALGLPVIASKIGALAELVTPKTGSLFESGNLESLCQAVEEFVLLASSSNQYEILQNNCRQRYLEHFTPEANLKILLDCYGSLAKAGENREAR